MTDPSGDWSPTPDTGFDLGFRPDYWVPENPLQLIVGNMVGEIRRHILKKDLLGDPVPNVRLPEEYRADILPEELRDRAAAGHPWFLGGEFLPEYLPSEVEVARIVLASTTMDVVSIRARREGGLIHYRAVDEYEGGYAGLGATTSSQPLTFAEMVELVEAVEDRGGGGGSYIDEVRRRNVDAGADLERMRDFVVVDSLFYPQLRALFDLKSQAWYEEKQREMGEGGWEEG